MAQKYLFGFMVLIAFIGCVSSRPSNNDASVQYLPFYGGAKGQYLEIKTDNAGAITSEKIIAEDKISSLNLNKKIEDENLETRILSANLLSLRTTASNLNRLLNLGRVLGYLGATEKARFKELLTSLSTTASNTVKIIEDVGDDVDKLFQRKSTQNTRRNEEQDDYIEEEGVGIEAPSGDEPQLPLGSTTIAEAKPVGLAVIGENGLAASRPIATAVASSGIALARPIATAVAGIDPSSLGINFQVNQITH